MGVGGDDGPVRDLDPETLKSLHNVDQELRSALPDFMIPSYYLPIHKFPLTSSGKVDTWQLQEWIRNLAKEQQLAPYSLVTQAEFQVPVTEMEVRLQKLLAEILNVEPDTIGRGDSFFRLGGDSIAAIRLVSAAREQGVRITVSSIFQDPRLSRIAASAVVEDVNEDRIEPWSLIPDNERELLVATAREKCGLSGSDEIEDMYPAAVLQEGLMSLAVKQPGSYIARIAYELPPDLDEGRFRAAWEETLRICTILRTRIITHDDRTFQAVVAQSAEWEIESLEDVRMEPCTRLCRYSLVDTYEGKLFTLVIHHAIFDGWSLPLIMGTLLHAYEHGTAPALTSYAGFIKYASHLDMPKARAFWQKQLENATRPSFPQRPGTTSDPRPATSHSLARHVPFDTTEDLPVTKATILRAAWTILLAMYNDNTQDITFGATVAGRQAPVAGIEKMAGPVIATVPVRVRLGPQQSLAHFLQGVQSQGAEMMPFEQMGIQNIAKLGPDTRNACDFSSLLVIQPYEILKDTTNQLMQLRTSHNEEDAASSALAGYFTYPLVWQCYFTETETALHVSFDSSVLSFEQVETMIEQFCHIVEQLVSPAAHSSEELTLADISVSGPYDMALARDWNNKVHTEIISSTFHSLVEEQARIRPNAQAICAWDRSLSYQELDTYSSRLASVLAHEHGVVTDDLVLVCFEKSAWFYVTILAVNKAGGAWVPLDPSHPRYRHETVASQSSSRLALVSPEQSEKCRGLVDLVVTISGESDLWTSNQRLPPPAVQAGPSDAAYVLFTSGTTGMPKGIVMEHGSLCTSQTAISLRLGLRPEHVRLLQFAAYVFDLSIGEMVAPLISGGCLCIPSEYDRMNDLVGFISRMRVNWAFLTPSFARILVPEQVPSLELLLLAGEPVGKDLLSTWVSHGVRLINGWGPSETCCFSTLQEWSSPDESPLNIGSPVGGWCWIVDSDDYKKLAPIGCVGEVVIQGPTIAREYLAFPEGSQASFVTDLPVWAPKMDSHYARFYKSGDLAYYNPDGTIEFVARKDAQVKVRGFRIELGEVEHHIRERLEGVKQVAVDVVSTNEDGQGTLNKLVAYLCFTSATSSLDHDAQDGKDMLLPLDAGLSQTLRKLKSYLEVRLPEYMVPSIFVPVGYMPFITSQKTDRRLLRSAISQASPECLTQYMLGDAEKESPVNERELIMQKLWTDILRVPADLIGRYDSFLELGGDSLTAMRLVTKAREHGIHLSVTSIFKDPRLLQVTESAAFHFTADVELVLEPWALIPKPRRASVAAMIKEQCGLPSSNMIENAYPVTALQEGLIALASKQPGSYMAAFSFELGVDVEIKRFKEAWERTTQICSALRTRIVLCSDQTIQAVIKDEPNWVRENGTFHMGYGTPLCTYFLTERGDKQVFGLTMHHAVFDGWSFNVIMRTLSDIYQKPEDSIAPSTSYVNFVKYALSLDQAQAVDYWHGQLKDALPPGFPRKPPATTSVAGSGVTTQVITHRVPFKVNSRRLVTNATILRAAWAIVMARYNDADDITFGAAVAGRQAPVPGIEDIVGPVLSTVPVRTRVKAQESVANFLLAIQKQAMEMIPYEHMGLQNIARISTEAREACDFSSMFSVLPSAIISDVQNSLLSPDSLPNGNTSTDFATYFTYPLVGQCFLIKDEATLELAYDPSALSSAQTKFIASQYSHVVQQLLSVVSNEKAVVGDITLCGDRDVAQIQQWHNAQPPLKVVDACIHHLISETAARLPKKKAIYTSNGYLTYEDLDHLSTKLGSHLRTLGVTRGSLIPFCLEKSSWAIISMLAIMKAGGAFVPLNLDHPITRQQRLLGSLHASIILVSQVTEKIFACVDINAVVVDSKFLSTLPESSPSADGESSLTPRDAAYVLFTSGSTGEPKGVIIEHRSLSSTVSFPFGGVNLTTDCRVLQFSSYVFDISVYEIFATLLFGGTLCIPSEEERLNRLPSFVNEAQVTCAMLTNSVAKLFGPADVPSLKTIFLAGEAPSQENIRMWARNIELINAYGPAEACIYASSFRLEPNSPSVTTIGSGCTARLWIVEPHNHNSLTPVGCIGELLVEGPGVARGYLNDPARTKQSFLSNAPWRPREDVQYMIYKTGDLARYNQDGSIEWISRKDSQMKIRGHRMEAGEVEYHIKQHIGPQSASSVQILEINGTNTLFAFISAEGQNAVDESPSVLPLEKDSLKLLCSLHEDLQAILPSYMMPTYYLPVGYLPWTASGKMNNRALQQWVSSLSAEQLAEYSLVPQFEFQLPITTMEAALQKLWGSVLKISPDRIGRSESFLRLGGDSIAAIRLVAAAREQNIILTVASIFRDPRLKMVAAAAIMEHGGAAGEASMEPWSLLPLSEHVKISNAIRQQCCLSTNDVIEDAYPVTPLQEGLMALSMTNPGSYTARFAFELAEDVDMHRFTAAWHRTLRSCSVLRTRIVNHGDFTVQAVLQEPELRLGIGQMGYGTALCQYSIESREDTKLFVLAMHHAIFDGWSFGLVMRLLAQAYEEPTFVLPPTPYANFVRYIIGLDQPQASSYWRKQLASASRPVYPQRPAPAPASGTDDTTSTSKTDMVVRRLPFVVDGQLPVTKATVLRAAWAIVLAKYNENADDIVFGAAVAGRQAPIIGIESIVGPVLSTVPVRVLLSHKQSVVDFLVSIQDQANEMVPFEHLGIQNIAKVSEDARGACDFSSLFTVQHSSITSEGRTGLLKPASQAYMRDDEATDLSTYFTYPLVGQCTISEQDAALELIYNSSVLSKNQAVGFAAHYEYVVQQLLSIQRRKPGQDLKLGDIDLFCDWDIQEIRKWHSVEQQFRIVEVCLHDLINRQATKCPDDEAIFSWDGRCSYSELERMTTLLGKHLQGRGVTKGSLVPICFEKSMWAIVSMLSINKAGGAFVPLSPNHPLDRRQRLVKVLQAPLILVSPVTSLCCQEINVPSVSISAEFVASLMQSASVGDAPDSYAVPDDAAYVIFTSGSTGEPKGVVIDHRAISSSIYGHCIAMNINSDSRVLQFSDYIFDATITECFGTLALGGTVCVPSDEQRLNNLTEFFAIANVNWTLLTPSFVRTLDREETLKTLRTLVVGGEALTRDIIDAWAGRVHLVNAYGPSEASVCIATYSIHTENAALSPKTLGRGCNSRLWVVDPENHNRLAPVHCVGELLIQGPTLAQGYLNSPDKTSQSFISNVPWLPSGQFQRLYKTGDLVTYDADGNIEYMGRKDNQLKLRGQRLEVGEIEFHIKYSLGPNSASSVQIIQGKGTENSAALVAFYSQTGKTVASTEIQGSSIMALDESTLEILRGVDQRLQRVLPAYMVPTYYLPIFQWPLMASGKTNYRALKEWALGLSPEDLTRFSLSGRTEFEPPTRTMEVAMQKLWGEVLGVEADTIGRNDSFLRLGGDSIAAIRLVAAAREQHIDLVVSSIFRDARLCAVAASALTNNGDNSLFAEPYSLIARERRTSIIEAVHKHCNLSSQDMIDDVYPATALQEGLMALAVKQPGSYMADFVFELAESVETGHFMKAWETTMEVCATLRTRIALLGDQTLQVVVRNRPEWASFDIEPLRMEYGVPLCRYSLSHGSKRLFKLTMHHAIFDGWSVGLILRTLTQAFEDNGSSISLVPYAGFVEYTLRMNKIHAAQYWENQLEGALQPVFPRRAIVSSPAIGTTSRTATFPVPFNMPNGIQFTKATVLRAAWAIVLSRYNDSTDVTFGAAVAGRQTPVSGIERMIGPVISTLPIRVKLESQQRVCEFLEQIQIQATDMMPYEHIGLQNIAKLSPDARQACDFSSLLVVQPQAVIGEMGNSFLKLHDIADDSTALQNGNKQQTPVNQYFSYPLVWQCYLAGSEVHLHITFDSSVINEKQIPLMVEHFCNVVKQLLSPGVHLGTSTVLLSSVKLCGPKDLELMIKWNKEFESTIIPSTLHDMVAEQAKIRPSAPAVFAWDGQLTYRELDDVSTSWGIYLSEKYSILPDELVTLCFEKSVWFYVAMLAVNKAGGAWVPLDPSHPSHRHKQVTKQAEARISLTSPTTASKCQGLVEHVVILSTDSNEVLAREQAVNPPKPRPRLVQPNHTAYVLFTSGTTGTPKGMVMEHEALCTSMTASGKRLKVNPDHVRLLQFAAYVFDLAIGEIIMPLISGACICVPSEHQRMNDLPKFVAESRANWAFLTPSFARILSPADVPNLEFLLLGGEAVGKDHLARWVGHVRLINAWGPSEACCFASFREYETANDSPTNIGFPVGARSWIVEADDYTRLTPIGCIGEVVLQGPTLAREYLAFEAGTKASFITELPEWAADRNHPQYSKFYKSGDLAYFNPDGTMEFVTRKDTQVKIRGFRIELGEVESHIHESLRSVQQVTVDVLRTDGISRLVAYLCFSSATRTPDSGNTDFSDMLLPMDEAMSREASALKSLLDVRLPSYMVPVIYIPVKYMPFITSQKTDRKILRAAATVVSKTNMAVYMLANTTKESPVTPMETEMQILWADILNISLEQIGRNDNFLHLGGDSLAAIRLVAKARQCGVKLCVASIFRDPRLRQVALTAQFGAEEDDSALLPWSLVSEGNRSLTQAAAEQQCKLPHGFTIEDIYPTTALQEGLMALAVKQPGSYTAKLDFELTGSDVDRFKAAWEHTLQACPALRTRIFRYESQTMQAVIDGKPVWQTSLSEVSDMQYGSALCQYNISRQSDRTFFSLTIHHAIFDGWSLSVIMRTLAQAYDNISGNSQPLPSYSRFIKYVMSLDQERAAEYWRDQLQGAIAPVFPARSASVPTARASSNRTVTRILSVKDSGKQLVTKATLLRAAWALVLSKYNGNTEDITFGAAVAGRQAPVTGIENIVGPVISTVPVRVKLDPQQSIAQLLGGLQAQAAEMMPFEQMGIQNISQLSSDAREACDFTSLFAVQHRAIFSDSHTSFLAQTSGESGGSRVTDYNTYFTYPLVGQCFLSGDEASLELIYDTSVFSDGQADAFAAQYDHVVQQLCAVQVDHGEQKALQVGQITLHGKWDTQRIKHWRENEPDLETMTDTIHELVTQRAASSPNKEAIFSWDGCFTYAELDSMVACLATYLHKQGATRGLFVPICFEKSMWTIVAMLAIMKAGAAFVPLSPDHPLSRRQQLVTALKAPLMLVSPSTLSKCQDIQIPLIVVSSSLMSSFATNEAIHASSCVEHTTDDSNGGAAYVLFTSGSTGEPKGVVIEHHAIASSIFGHGTAMGLGPDSRVLQFSNYIFDGSITECLATLVFGGCVCVPSDEQRLGRLEDFINEANVNWAMLTPSFVRTLNRDSISSLQTLVLGGEAPAKDVIDTWLGNVRLLNAYGPAEASVCIATQVIKSSEASPRTIGRGRNANLWVIDTDNEDRLAAIGCVGELAVQGPGLARGYLNDEARTKRVFIDSPDWLPSGPYQRVYKTGDLVKYNDDGTIEYVGRKDTQIKLRGQRLEPAEVEHHIRELLPIARQVAVSKALVASQETLIAFTCIYSRQNDSSTLELVPMDEGLLQTFVALSENLGACLPSFMVPAYFIPVTMMPTTATGKLDVRLLEKTFLDMDADQVRQYAAFQKTPHQEPRNTAESELRRLFSNVLGVEEAQISINDSFHHLGGDSLKVMTLQGHIRHHFDKALSIQMLSSRKMSIRNLAPLILAQEMTLGDARSPEEDYGKLFESLLRQVWPPRNENLSAHVSTSLPNGAYVLLTGGTGYLGSALLHHLLNEPQIDKVVVLVRAQDKAQAQKRVKRSAQIAGWWSEPYLAKLEIWKGDLSMRGFGLSQNEWKALGGKLEAGNINAIVHNGAAVDWSADFAALRSVNVDSTLQLIDIAFTSPVHPKLVYISGGGEVSQEEDRVSVARSLPSHGLGYSQTKVLSELIVCDCAARLPAHQNIISTVKPGRIIGTPERGVANTDDLIWRIVAGAARLQAYPQEPAESRMLVADTDSIANRVLQQLKEDTDGSTTNAFKAYAAITSNISVADFWRITAEVLDNASVHLEPVSWEDWLLQIQDDLESEGENHALWPVQHFLGRLGSHTSLNGQGTGDTETEGSLKHVERAVRRNVEYLIESGFLEGPGKKRQDRRGEVFKRRGL